MSCPFHGDDKHPSMKVYDANKGYHCFVCGEGGDVFDFVMKIDNVSFDDAVRIVARIAGIDIPEGELSDQEKARIDEQKRQREAMAKKEDAKKKRMAEISETLRLFDGWRRQVEPFGSVFCALTNRMVALQQEWDGLFAESK